jgi:hypothetical protein
LKDGAAAASGFALALADAAQQVRARAASAASVIRVAFFIQSRASFSP